ncbi:MAG: hypothetical protein K9G46_06590 [Flavobacteriales bacterium]|nr:hypothetical protein [Flavobacteriales bacterium]
MRRETIQLFIFLFLSVFIFNLVQDAVHLPKKESSSYCEVNEVKDFQELGSRLRVFDPQGFLFVAIHLDLFKNLFASSDNSELCSAGSRAFFPNALHVPIYLGKCVFNI